MAEVAELPHKTKREPYQDNGKKPKCAKVHCNQFLPLPEESD
jgi:hypothetical protein